MNSLFNRERIIAIVCFCFASWIYYEAGKFPTSVLDTVGSTHYPRFLAIIMGIASITHFIVPRDESGDQKAGHQEPKAFAVLLVSIIAYVLIMPLIGFIAATIPFLLVLTFFFDRREWAVKLKIAVPYSILFTIAMYFCFGKILGVLLPGFFGIEG